MGGREHRAALAFGYVAAVLILVAGALFWVLLDPGASKIMDMSQNMSSGQSATNHINTVEAVWNNFPYFLMFLGLMFLLARAYFESEVGR